ncbi:MAG: hypothetical protein ABI980_10560, partial [Nitrospirota bacterium]
KAVDQKARVSAYDPVSFGRHAAIPKLKNKSARGMVETDQDVTATIADLTYRLSAYTPMSTSGG